MKYPLVSTVIPVYNRQTLVIEAINSAIRQTYPNHEVVVVDNCSTDRTFDRVSALAAKHDKIRVFRNASNVGPVRNWKRGVSEARGEYCNILFSDDTIEDNFIESLIPDFSDDTAFVTCGFKILKNDAEWGRTNFQSKGLVSKEDFIRFSILKDEQDLELVSPGCSIFRTKDLRDSILEDIYNEHGIDFSMHGAGNDQLIYLNIIARYKQMKFVDQLLANYRDHNDSFTVSLGKQLLIPRDWARRYFVCNFENSVKRKFKSILLLRSISDSRFLDIYRSFDGGFDLPYLVKLAFKYGTQRVFSKAS